MLKRLTIIHINANGEVGTHIENGRNFEVLDEHHGEMIGYQIVSYDTSDSNAVYPVEVDNDDGTKYIPDEVEEVEFNGNKYNQVASWMPL